MGKTNQTERILQYMQDFGSITTYQAFVDLGVTRLPSRIWDLRRSGYAVKDEFVKDKNRYGDSVSYKRYWLEQ